MPFEHADNFKQVNEVPREVFHSMQNAADNKTFKAITNTEQSTANSILPSLELVEDSKKTAPNARLEKAASEINEASNGGLTGAGTDESRLWNALVNLNSDDYAKVNEIYEQKYGAKYAKPGQKFGVMDELKDELGGQDLQRFTHLVQDKLKNDVPKEMRTEGSSLIKPGSHLKAGELTEIELADGRTYDAYVPRNADKRGPVIIAMHGAAAGDPRDVMQKETGLIADAEKTGSIVVFAHPKVRDFDSAVGKVPGVAWNVPDRTNLTKAADKSYDDRVYFDNIISDLNKQANVADKVGMMGFSDGGRMAQVYAADRLEKVAGFVSMDGTWMAGDARPKQAVPGMIVHGTEDRTLPFYGGIGTIGGVMNKLVDTNLDKSQPFMQEQVWKEAAGYTDRTSVVKNGNVEEIIYSRKGAPELKEYLIAGADHGIHDYKNDGSRTIQAILGSPQLDQNFSLKGAEFLKDNIVKKGN